MESLCTEAELPPSAAHAGDTTPSNAKRTTLRADPLPGNPNNETPKLIKILFIGLDQGISLAPNGSPRSARAGINLTHHKSRLELTV
jgi:hypothetical protein